MRSKLSLQLLRGDALGPAYECTKEVVRVGRDADNDLVLADAESVGVSRHHAEIRYGDGRWQVVDLNSTNGTYLNRRRVSTSDLSDADELQFGGHGPRVRVSLPGDPQTTLMVEDRPSRTEPTKSELFPLQMGLPPLIERGYLLHGLLTLGVLIGFWLLFSTGNRLWGLGLLHLFFTAASVYAAYLLCGKQKPWWLLAGVAVFTAVSMTILISLIRALPLAYMPDSWEPRNLQAKRPFPIQFVYMLLMAGIPEELTKILPILLLVRWGKRIGRWLASGATEVSEPLDGILLGVASAAGFTVFEGLEKALQASDPGLAFYHVIFRSIGNIFGHGAYAGIFGYYVGLAVLRPRRAQGLLLCGFLIAALTHAAWNSMGLFNIVAAAFAYAALVASILQARKMSPTRAMNFATTLGRTG